jgi:hypothetical protein
MDKLTLAIRRLEKELSRPVNYSVFPMEEWKEKVRKADPFVVNVIAGPKVWLIGDENAIR